MWKILRLFVNILTADEKYYLVNTDNLLDNCLKSPISGDPSKGNMGNGSKDVRNLKESNFTIFIENCEGT